jgi:hypothetical protein
LSSLRASSKGQALDVIAAARKLLMGSIRSKWPEPQRYKRLRVICHTAQRVN